MQGISAFQRVAAFQFTPKPNHASMSYEKDCSQFQAASLQWSQACKQHKNGWSQEVPSQQAPSNPPPQNLGKEEKNGFFLNVSTQFQICNPKVMSNCPRYTPPVEADPAEEAEQARHSQFSHTCPGSCKKSATEIKLSQWFWLLLLGCTTYCFLLHINRFSPSMKDSWPLNGKWQLFSSPQQHHTPA